jgi:undecaprenyl diphosphate synthase
MGGESVPAGERATKADSMAALGLAPEQLPRHVAVIMDGNGRWAQRRGMPRIEGHRRGVRSVRAIVEECCRLGVGQLTLYCLSVENWKRPKLELAQLMRLLRRYLIDERPTIMKQNIRLQIIGRRDGIPNAVQAQMDKSLALSAGNTGMTLCLAINYGGRTELIDAVQQIAREAADGSLPPASINAETISQRLYTRGMPDPDLLIRTAGEFRVSNFLLWQISYAEIFVTETCWPDFSTEHLHEALRSFARRERRYGGLTP